MAHKLKNKIPITRPDTIEWHQEASYSAFKPYDKSYMQFIIISDSDDCYNLYYKGDDYDSNLKFISESGAGGDDIDEIKKYVQKNYVKLIEKYGGI